MPGKRHITIWTVLLFPLALLYGLIIKIRNLFFDWELLPSREFDLPIISVGNITVGGTGKTPHIEYLVELLKDEFNIATLSRGYKRKTRHFILASEISTVDEIGDEPRQLKQKYPDISVAVDRNRANGIEHIRARADKTDVILLDDAFQHRHVKPGKSILLIDFNRMIQDDFMLPAGRLREQVSAKERANIILVTKSPDRLKPIEMRNIAKNMNLGLHQHLFFTRIRNGELHPVYDLQETKEAEYFKNKKAPVLILAGIANPRSLRKYARSISTHLQEISYPDHHQYTLKDLKKISRIYRAMNNPDALILTTEKDAMRLQGLDPDDDIRKALYYITIHVDFLNDDQEEFNHIILDYVRSNKRDNILHQGAN